MTNTTATMTQAEIASAIIEANEAKMAADAAKAAKVTRRDALEAAVAKFDIDDPIRATLEKMLHQVSTRSTAETPSQAKAKAERAELLQACIEAMKANPDTPINSTWLKDNVDGIRTTQKATALMSQGIKDGTIEKVYMGKKVFYHVL